MFAYLSIFVIEGIFIPRHIGKNGFLSSLEAIFYGMIIIRRESPACRYSSMNPGAILVSIIATHALAYSVGAGILD